MINANHFNAMLLHAINGDIGKGRKQDFSRFFLTSEPSSVRKVFNEPIA
jgi:hypothetical protein